MDTGTIRAIEVFLNIGLPFLVLMGAYFIGSWIERRHFREIEEREKALKGMPVTTFELLPTNWQISRAELVSGSVVVSLDYFKRVIAGLRGIFGGRIKTYEPLLERARREALLRMNEAAREKGLNAVINVRLETSRLANARNDGKGTAGVEMLAFGTGLRVDKKPKQAS